LAKPASGYHERACHALGFVRVAGVDEVGRGCLFGPVTAAAVILDPARPVRGLRDSKQLEPEERERLAVLIRERCVAWAVAEASAAEIDRINILEASRLAMRRAVSQLAPPPDYLLIDAIEIDYAVPQKPIIHGDALSRSIAAASILAKVHRDGTMAEWEARYPGYGLARNKGYGTAEHLEGLRSLGPAPDHRRSFEPVRQTRQLTLFPEQAEAAHA